MLWLRNIKMIALSWHHEKSDSYCMNHAVWVILLLKRLFFELIQVENQFNQLVRQFNRGRKPSGWKAHVRFSGKTYRVRLYSTTRGREIFISYRVNFFGWGLPAGQTFDRGRDPPGWKAKSPFSIHPYQVCPYLTTRGRYRGIYMHFMTILSNYDPPRYSGPWEPQTCIYRRNSFCIWKRRL